MAFVNLYNALSKVDPSLIEIEFKYARLTSTQGFPNIRALKDLPTNIREQIEEVQR